MTIVALVSNLRYSAPDLTMTNYEWHGLLMEAAANLILSLLEQAEPKDAVISSATAADTGEASRGTH